jgi:hypothetical protein
LGRCCDYQRETARRPQRRHDRGMEQCRSSR